MAGSSLGDTKGSSPFAMVGAGQVVEDALLGPIKKINRSNSMIYKTQLICTRFDALKKFILYKKKREREKEIVWIFGKTSYLFECSFKNSQMTIY